MHGQGHLDRDRDRCMDKDTGSEIETGAWTRTLGHRDIVRCMDKDTGTEIEIGAWTRTLGQR